MTDPMIQTSVEQSKELLKQAQVHFDNSHLRESEACALAAASLLEAHVERSDLGSETDSQSQKYDVLNTHAWSYHRLATVRNALSEHNRALKDLEIALGYCERVQNLPRKADILIGIGSAYQRLSDYAKAHQYFEESLELNRELKRTSSIATCLNHIGIVYYFLGIHNKALECFSGALELFRELGEERLAAGSMVNIGNVHLALSLREKALEYFERAYTVLDSLGDKPFKANVTQNIGLVHLVQESYETSLEYLDKALVLFEEAGSRSGTARCILNIGLVHKKLGLYEKALEYYSRALLSHEELGDRAGIGTATGNIGSLFASPDFAGYDASKAELYLLKAIAIEEELGAKQHLFESELALSELYENEKRWEDFAIHFKKYHSLKEEVQSVEARKQAEVLEQQRQLFDREQQLVVERTRSIATSELLHKVLPLSIAERLVKGERIADYYQNVSILFADIVGFTPIASRMPAKVVLAFLNFVFSEFDKIVKKNGCEKIKTIGDGYLAVAGVPVSCDDHAERLTQCALDMMNEIMLPDEIRKFLPKNSVFSIRIGLHTGAAFAGIVGEERFVYDIYSDAVNIAARMESHGEPGKIHISDEFCFHLQNRMDASGDNLGGIRFEEREEMEIKGKGMMRTYFLVNDKR